METNKPVAWLYEDELPDSYPYETMFPYSKVDGVRMFPEYAPQPGIPKTITQEQQPISHDWDGQDKCRRCGDRDWYAGPICTPKQPVEQQPTLTKYHPVGHIPDAEKIISDKSLDRQIGGIGDQIHNLGCRYQNDEELSEHLSGLACSLWEVAKKVYLMAPAPITDVSERQPDLSQLVEALSALRGCIMETRGPDAYSALVLADAALAAYHNQRGKV